MWKPPAPTGPMARALGSGRPSRGLRWLAPLGRPPSTRPLNCGVIGWQSLPCSVAPNHWIPCFTTTPVNRRAMTHKGFSHRRSIGCHVRFHAPVPGKKGLDVLVPVGLHGMDVWRVPRKSFVQRNKTAEPGARREQGTAVPILSLPGATMEGFLLFRKITPYPFLQIH